MIHLQVITENHMKVLDFTSIIYNYSSHNFVVLVAYNRSEKVLHLTGKYTKSQSRKKYSTIPSIELDKE